MSGCPPSGGDGTPATHPRRQEVELSTAARKNVSTTATLKESDRRLAVRHVSLWPVRVRNGEELLRAESLNISRTGLSFTAPRRIVTPETLELDIVPAELTSIRSRVRIAWQRSATEDRVVYGAHFLSMDPGDVRLLLRFLELLRRGEGVWSEFQPLVRRLIRQYGDTPEIRQDLAGEIYCRFTDLLEAYDPARGVPLKPYLVRQLNASVYTYARSGWRSHKREVSLEAVSGIREMGERVDPSREWDEKISTQQVIQLLPAAIRKLPKRQRQVLIWRYYEDRSFEDIAALLDVQQATTRSLLRHAINNLRKQMGEVQ